MNPPVLRILRMSRHTPQIPLPAYATPGSSGMDLAADVVDDLEIPPGGRAMVPTGLAFAVPAGYEVQVRPRSGLAAKAGVTVLNAPGTIDSDYRGEVRVILINLSDAPFTVRRGDRIAQAIVAPVVQVDIVETDSLDETDRGAGGFGSTGR